MKTGPHRPIGTLNLFFPANKNPSMQDLCCKESKENDKSTKAHPRRTRNEQQDDLWCWRFTNRPSLRGSVQQWPRNYSVSFKDSHLSLRVSVSSVGVTYDFLRPLVPNYCFLLALTHHMDLISTLQACPCSPQQLLMEEKGVVAMGALEWWFLPSMGTAHLEIWRKPEIFVLGNCTYTRSHSHAIIGVGQNLPKARSWS